MNRLIIRAISISFRHTIISTNVTEKEMATIHIFQSDVLQPAKKPTIDIIETSKAE